MKGELVVLLLVLVGTGTARAQDGGTHTLKIDPAASEITYAMSHPMHDWTGTSRKVSGTILVDDAGRVVGGTVQAPVLSFDSGNENRDSHMAEVVEFYLYPDVRFEADSVRYEAAPDSAVVYGRLSLHGVTRPVAVPVRIEAASGGLLLEGAFDVTVTEFDMKLPSLLGIKTKDWIGVRFTLKTVPAG